MKMILRIHSIWLDPQQYNKQSRLFTDSKPMCESIGNRVLSCSTQFACSRITNRVWGITV